MGFLACYVSIITLLFEATFEGFDRVFKPQFVVDLSKIKDSILPRLCIIFNNIIYLSVIQQIRPTSPCDSCPLWFVIRKDMPNC
jgi:hypothetical protein